MMRIGESRRAVLRLGAVMVILGAVAALVLGVTGVGGGPGRTVPLAPGEVATLPTLGLFGGSVALYGDVPTGERRPGVRDLGCVLLDGDGDPSRQVLLNELGALRLDPVHDPRSNATLTPLLTISGYVDGSGLLCRGATATAAEPLYMAGVSPYRSLVRWVLVPFGVLGLLIGFVGVVVFRPAARGA